MNTSQIYIIISIPALVFIVILFLAARRKGKKLTPLAGFAWALILAGIIFSEDRLIGYSLIGLGVALAIIEIYHIKKELAR